MSVLKIDCSFQFRFQNAEMYCDGFCPAIDCSGYNPAASLNVIKRRRTCISMKFRLSLDLSRLQEHSSGTCCVT